MIRLAVRVREDAAEIVLAELLELVPAGVEETRPAAGVVEYAVYGAPGELPALPDVRAVVADALVEISTSELDDDWGERWRRFHRPVLVEGPAPRGARGGGVSLRIRPPWEPPRPRPGQQEIVIDPGQAFGTGGHATTLLCTELLLSLAAERRAGALVDMGTGSGVLAIAAARLGFAPVLALDNDRESVRAAHANARANGVAIDVREFDLRTDRVPAVAPGDAPLGDAVVVANLLRPLLLALANTLPCAPAHLIAGGMLDHEVEEVLAAFSASLGMRAQRRLTSSGWAAAWLRPAAQPSSSSSVAARTFAR